MLNRCLLLSQFFVSLAVPVYNATAAHGYQLLPALPASSTLPCCVMDPSCSSTDFLASGIEGVHGFLNGLQTVNLQVTPVGDALLDRPIIEKPSSVTSVSEDRKASPTSLLFSGRGDSSEDSMLNRCLLLSQPHPIANSLASPPPPPIKPALEPSSAGIAPKCHVSYSAALNRTRQSLGAVRPRHIFHRWLVVNTVTTPAIGTTRQLGSWWSGPPRTSARQGRPREPWTAAPPNRTEWQLARIKEDHGESSSRLPETIQSIKVAASGTHRARQPTQRV
ncbi:hypothetical protein ISCGN_001848 [Ixodes scapularis]